MIGLPSIWGRRWVRHWARTSRGQRRFEELLDVGYLLIPPVSGGAINLDGVDDQVTRGGTDDASLDVADNTSLCLQVICKLDAVGATGRGIAGKKAGLAASNIGYLLRMSSGENVNWRCSDGTDQIATTNDFNMVAGVWNTLTGILTANGATNDDLIIYANTELRSTVNSTVLGSIENNQQFRLGTVGGGGEFWDGGIAAARVWIKSGQWTSAEIDYFVQNWNTLLLPPDANQRLQWLAADPGQTSLTDLSGNGLTGTLVGTTYEADPFVIPQWHRNRPERSSALIRM